jgi:hypothetical protein
MNMPGDFNYAFALTLGDVVLAYRAAMSEMPKRAARMRTILHAIKVFLSIAAGSDSWVH